MIPLKNYIENADEAPIIQNDWARVFIHKICIPWSKPSRIHERCAEQTHTANRLFERQINCLDRDTSSYFVIIICLLF